MFGKSKEIQRLWDQVDRLTRDRNILFKERKQQDKKNYLLYHKWNVKEAEYSQLYSTTGMGKTRYHPHIIGKWFPPKIIKGLKKTGYTLKEAYYIQTEILEGETK